jgi:hypothetical protein
MKKYFTRFILLCGRKYTGEAFYADLVIIISLPKLKGKLTVV